jgi:hypothetical protein
MVCRNRWRNLVERALTGRLVGTPSHQLRAVPEAVAGDVIEPHLDHEFGPKRLPFATALGAPSARAAGRLARKSWRLTQFFKSSGQRRPIRIGYRRGEADMVEFTVGIIKTEQQRSDLAAVAREAKSADNAIRRAQSLYLDPGA